MKRAAFLFVIPIIGSLGILYSCQNDEETMGPENSHLRFLSVKEENLYSINFCNPDTNYVNFHEALLRVLGHKNGQTVNASEVKVSPSLFAFISDVINKEQSTTRSIEPGKISTSEYDCTACTLTNVLSELLGMSDYNSRKNIYKRVWEYMCYTYGSYGLQDNERGIGYSSLLRRYFKYVALIEKPIRMYTPTGQSENTNGSRIIAVIKNDKGEYHSVTVIDHTKSLLFYRDDQNDKYDYCDINSVEVAEPDDNMI